LTFDLEFSLRTVAASTQDFVLLRTPFSLAVIFGYHLGLFLTQAAQRFRIGVWFVN